MLRRLIAGLSAFSLSAIVAAPALAAPPADVFKTPTGSVVSKNMTLNVPVTVEFPNVPTIRSIRADFCGQVVVTSTNTAPLGATIEVDPSGTPVTITIASLPVLALPRCTDNTLAEARPDNYRTPDGRVVLVGRTPGIRYEIGIVGVAFRVQRRPNACGFIEVRPTDNLPIGATITIAGTTHTLASLPESNAPTCRTINNSPVMYIPESWL